MGNGCTSEQVFRVGKGKWSLLDSCAFASRAAEQVSRALQHGLIRQWRRSQDAHACRLRSKMLLPTERILYLCLVEDVHHTQTLPVLPGACRHLEGLDGQKVPACTGAAQLGTGCMQAMQSRSLSPVNAWL